MKVKNILLALALAGALNASAAVRTFVNNTTSNADWWTATNWASSFIPTVSDSAIIVSNSSALLSGTTATISSMYLGYYTATTSGYGALTLSNASMTVSGSLLLGNTGLTNSTALPASTLSLTNNSYFYVGSSVLSIGRGYNATISNTNMDAYLYVDSTSSISTGSTSWLELGRRFGRGYLILQGDSTSGAVVTSNYLNMSADNGTGSLTMGTNSRLTTITASVGSYSTIVNNGGTLQLATTTSGNTTVALGSSIALTGGTLSVGNTLTISGASASGAVSLSTVTAVNSTLSIGRWLATNTTTSLSGSTLSTTMWESVNSNTRTTFSNSVVSIQSSVSAPSWTYTYGGTAYTTFSGSTLSMGINGKANFGRMYFLNSVMSLSDGAQLYAGTTFSFLTSSGTINASTVTVGSTTGAFTVGTGSSLILGSASSLLIAGTTSTDSNTVSSTLSIMGAVTVSGGSTVSLYTNYSTNNNTALLSLAGTGSLVVSDSQVSVIGALTQTEASTLGLVNSALSVSGNVSQSSTSILSLSNSSMVIGGQLLQQNSGTAGNYWINSTVSAAAWGARFSSAKTTLSNTVFNLSAATAQSIAGYTDSTAFIYLTNASSLNVGSNAALYVGRLSVGNGSTFSITAGNVGLTAALSVSGGYASVTGGTLTMDSTNRATYISVANGGTLSVSGTGIVAGALSTAVASGSTFSGALYVGTLPGTLPTSYVSTQTLSVQSGSKFFGSVNVAADGNVSLNLTGAASSLAAVTAQSLTFDSSSIVTIDFADLTLSGDAQLTLLLADTVSGLNLTNIVTKNLDAAYSVVYSTETIGVQQALIASLTTIPEPAIAAVLMGLLGLVAVARRRR